MGLNRGCAVWIETAGGGGSGLIECTAIPENSSDFEAVDGD